jgi:hypothetical protein
MIGKSIGLANTLALLAGLSGLAFLVTAVLGRGVLPIQTTSTDDEPGNNRFPAAPD